MDPITLAITSALVNLGIAAINDAYQALKAALQKKYGIKSDLTNAIKQLEKKPESIGRKKVLQEEIIAQKADKDTELIELSKVIIELAKNISGNVRNQQTVIQTVKGDNNIFSGSGNISIDRNSDKKK